MSGAGERIHGGLAKVICSAERIGHRHSLTQHADKIRNVVVKRDAGSYVFRCSNRQRRIEQAAITCEDMIDCDVA
jgi:hypothetical protein